MSVRVCDGLRPFTFSLLGNMKENTFRTARMWMEGRQQMKTRWSPRCFTNGLALGSLEGSRGATEEVGGRLTCECETLETACTILFALWVRPLLVPTWSPKSKRCLRHSTCPVKSYFEMRFAFVYVSVCVSVPN